MKRRSVCLLMLILLVVFSYAALAHEKREDSSHRIESNFETDEYSEYYIRKELKQNTERMRQLFGSKAEARVDEKSSVEIIIQKDLTKVLMSIEYLGSRQKTELYGTCECVQTGEITGYVGVYEGFISPIEGRVLSANERGLIPVIVDAVFTSKEVQVVITLGYADEKYNPDILFYGQSSDTLGAISTEDARRAIEVRTLRDEIGGGGGNPTIGYDGTCRYRGSVNFYMGSYKVGTLSVFHAPDLRNQAIMSTYVKINTTCNKAFSYVANDLGYGSHLVKISADTIDTSICGNHNNLHALANSFIPQNNVTTTPIHIPVYLGPQLGINVFTIDHILSSTSVTTSGYSSNPSHPNNKITWNLFKSRGWNPLYTDGNHATQTGISGVATYTYEGVVNGNVTRTITSTGRIRFEYVVQYFYQDMQRFHIPTNIVSKTTSVTIHP